MDKFDGKNINDIVNHPDIARDISTLNAHMGDVDKETQDKVRAFLSQLLIGIDREIEVSKEQLKDQSQVIETAKKNTEACLAYIKTTTK